MTTLTEAAMACCAHLSVKWTETKHPGGLVSGRWLCTDCGNEFELRTVAYGRGVNEGTRAQMSAILFTIGGTVEGRPTLAINYLQRLRELVENEQKLVECRVDLDQAAKVTEQLRAEIDETRRISKEEIGKRDDWNVELLGVIRLACDTAEHAQLNNRALTGGDERRLQTLINACKGELGDDDHGVTQPLITILRADYERLIAQLPATRPGLSLVEKPAGASMPQPDSE